MKKIEWTNQTRKLSELIPAKYNPRKMTDKQKSDLNQSLTKFSLADPIIINTNNIVIGGHQRLKLLTEQKATAVDVRVPNRKLTAREEKELNLRLNKNLGTWDEALLADFGIEMLSDVGFTDAELDKIFPANNKPDDDWVPAPPKKPKSKPGEIYTIGKHRIMCGDSTNPDHVAKLMDGRKADMIFTDPPYNVDYSGRGKETSNKIKNDNQTEEAFRNFLNAVFKNYRTVSKDGAAIYVCYASRTHREFEDALNLNNYEVKNQIIWAKTVASMGWGDYRWKHEPILYAHQSGSKTPFFGDRCQYTEWTQEMTDEELLAMVKKNIEKEEKGGSTIWRMSRDYNYRHPTQKPVQLIRTAIVNSSKRGWTVLDLFLGSGSTIIAAEKTGRVCYGMELDPIYCDVIIKRFEEYTGEPSSKK
jgi:DNA modification methylase